MMPHYDPTGEQSIGGECSADGQRVKGFHDGIALFLFWIMVAHTF